MSNKIKLSNGYTAKIEIGKPGKVASVYCKDSSALIGQCSVSHLPDGNTESIAPAFFLPFRNLGDLEKGIRDLQALKECYQILVKPHGNKGG